MMRFFAKKRTLTGTIFAIALGIAIPAQEKVDQGRISIAIPELVALGGASKAEIEGVTSLIATEVANLPIFEVLERKASAAIYDEISFQLLSAGQMDDAVRDSRIKGARALLVGSYGRLYGRIVIASRLVDLQTGRVLFATSIYTDESDFKDAVKGLALTIMEKGFELGQIVTMEDIKQLVHSKNWTEARRLIDIHIRSNSPDDTTRALFATITDGLAGEYYKQAQRYVSQRLFAEARLRIAEAIALKPDGRFFEYRNTINSTQEEWEFKQKILAARRADSLRTGKATVDAGEALITYFKNLSVEGAHVPWPCLSSPAPSSSPRTAGILPWSCHLSTTLA